MKPNMKKLLILNVPYLLFVWLFMKIGEAFRLSPGADLSGKLLHIMEGVTAAFESPLPSLNGQDFLIGVAGAVILRIAVYMKGKNAKKYRKGVEYGSARWGNAKDIEPYIDPDFYNNVLLTQTERLTMNSRPKSPKYARNKNVLVIGGSGSGKTRFFVKPNLMQMHSSYCVTDPKGTILIECGKLLEKGGYKIKVLNTINFKKSMHYKGTSWKAKLKAVIDATIPKAKDFDDFLRLMEAAGYEIKRGKYISFRAPGQERFTRSKTLGEAYTVEAITERIAGKYRAKPKALRQEKAGVSMLIDIQNSIKAAESKGYEQWAKIHNLKQAAKTLNC